MRGILFGRFDTIKEATPAVRVNAVQGSESAPRDRRQ